MAGLLLCPLGQLVPVGLTHAQRSNFTPPAHPAEGGLANVEGFRGLLGRQPLFLLARGAVILSNGVLDEVLDSL